MCRAEKRDQLKFAFFVSVVFCVLYSGCGSDSDEKGIPPEEGLQNGWAEYDSGNYGAAILAFEGTLSNKEDASAAIIADAYNGLGWAYLSFSESVRINQANLDTALGKFQEAVSNDATNADAWVGKAGLLLIRKDSQDDFRKALEAIDSALKGNTEYLYRHDYDSEADLYALKSQCYYYLGEQGKALEEVNRALAIERNNNLAQAIRGLL